MWWWCCCGLCADMTCLCMATSRRMHPIWVRGHLGANSRRPRHPRALDDQQLLAVEGSQKNPLLSSRMPCQGAATSKLSNSWAQDLALHSPENSGEPTLPDNRETIAAADTAVHRDSDESVRGPDHTEPHASTDGAGGS